MGGRPLLQMGGKEEEGRDLEFSRSFLLPLSQKPPSFGIFIGLDMDRRRNEEGREKGSSCLGGGIGEKGNLHGEKKKRGSAQVFRVDRRRRRKRRSQFHLLSDRQVGRLVLSQQQPPSPFPGTEIISHQRWGGGGLLSVDRPCKKKGLSLPSLLSLSPSQASYS